MSLIARRHFLATLGYGTATATIAPLVAHAADAPQRNVLFIAVDDLRPQLGCYGKPHIKSPHIDRLAAQGVTFDRAYCQQAVCAPSRISLLSGCRPDTTKVYDLNNPLRKKMPNVLTLPEHFRKNGYETVSIGKIYHHRTDDPQGWSTEPWSPTGDWKGRGYLDPASLKAVADYEKKSKTNTKGRGPAWEGPDVADSAYPEGKMADRAIEEMNRLKDKPFFLAVGFIRPHLPFNAPKRYWDLYAPEDIQIAPHPNAPEGVTPYSLTNFGELRNYVGIPKGRDPIPDSMARTLIHGYYACVSYTDAQVGRLLAELDRLGLADTTTVVLWGDHGWKLGDHGEWCKHTNFEIDTHVPLIFRAPGLKGAGQHSAAFAEFVDIYPTLCELSGLNVPDHLEGTSLKPVLNQPDRAWKKAAFSQYPRRNIMGYSMRTDEWRYTEWQDQKTGDVKARELYDHRTGHGENVNVAASPENRAIVKTLSAMLKAGWQAALPEP